MISGWAQIRQIFMMYSFQRLLAFQFLYLVSAQTQAANLITLDFQGTMTAQQEQTFVDAAAYWNSVITGYDLMYDAGGNELAHGLTITATLYSGEVGGVLGSAGPLTVTYYDDSPTSPNPSYALLYATTGSMQFDSLDVDSLIANNTFYGVVLHEMAHVLGIGTLWTYNNNLNGTIYPLYTEDSGQYTGPNGLAAWQAEFGQTSATYVPVELEGGEGTANAHWDEISGGLFDTGITSNLTGLDMSHELMTGWSSDTFFVSTLTLGALDDLGYTVDYSKAGIVTYVPEPSAIPLGIATFPLLWKRRRK